MGKIKKRTPIKRGGQKPSANYTAAEQKLRKWGAKKGVANTFPGSSVKATDSMGANYTKHERSLMKKTRKKRNGPR